MSVLNSAAKGDINEVNRLLKAGGNANEKGQDGSTGLHYASRYGHIAVVKVLVEYGSNVNETNATGNSALHLACGYQHIDVVKYLVQKGATIDAENNDAKKPIDYVTNPEIRQYLDVQQQRMQLHRENSSASSLFGTPPMPTPIAPGVGLQNAPSPPPSSSTLNFGASQSVIPEKVKIKIAELVAEKHQMQTKCTQLEARLAEMENWKKELDMKLKEKIERILEEKHMALEKLKQYEIIISHGKGDSSLKERLEYLVNENESFMSKISDLESKLYNAKVSAAQVEQY